MKILHVVPSYLPATRYGGPIVSVHALCRSLAERGHEVSVFTTSVDGQSDSPVPHGVPVNLDGVNVWYFASKHLRRLYWSPAMAQALEARIRDFDIVHLHSVFLWPTLAAARTARSARVPYIVAPRGMMEKGLIERKNRWIKSAWITLFEKRSLTAAAAIHATSRREVDELERFGFDLPRTVLVPNGVDAASVSGPPPKNVTADRYALYLGRINWKKGLDRLIEALKWAPAVHLVIAGNDEDNYSPRLRAIAQTFGVADRITWIGPVSGAEKAALLRHAQVTILPSYSENFGNVVLEAMAQGCPVIVTPEVGAAEIVAEAGAGIVAEGAPAALGLTIASVLERPSEWKQMGERGRATVDARFTWPAIARQMEDTYASLAPR